MSTPHQLFNLLVIFTKLYGGLSTEVDLDVIIYNYVSSTIPKWHTLKFLRWMQNLPQSTWDHKILYADRSSEGEELSMR
jgi:hypothetical protein